MSQPEQRRSERLLLTIPIRVLGFATAVGEFSEDTHTVMVNRTGARIALKHHINPDDTIRIVNLENYREADFRIVGPTSWTEGEITEWGTECLEPGRDIWGIEFAPPLTGEAGALLECRVCQNQGFSALTPMELEVLDTAGIIQRPCSQCGRPTYWTHADITRRPKELPPSQAMAAPAPAARPEKEIDKRKAKRLGMKLPILVRARWREEEISKTENLSKGGLAVSLAMDLAVGDIMSVICPYSPSGQNIAEKAEVRRRGAVAAGGRRLYGLRYIR